MGYEYNIVHCDVCELADHIENMTCVNCKNICQSCLDVYERVKKYLLFGNPLFGINTEHHVTFNLFKSDGSIVTTLYDGVCILKEKKTSLEDSSNYTGNNFLSVIVTFEDK